MQYYRNTARSTAVLGENKVHCVTSQVPKHKLQAEYIKDMPCTNKAFTTTKVV